MEFLSDIASLINSTLRISTPLVFAAMAGIFAERSGVKVTVRDGGDGFKVEQFFDKLGPACLQKEVGHGLLLMKRLTDDLEFNLEGNEVTLAKNARPA